MERRGKCRDDAAEDKDGKHRHQADCPFKAVNDFFLVPAELREILLHPVALIHHRCQIQCPGFACLLLLPRSSNPLPLQLQM